MCEKCRKYEAELREEMMNLPTGSKQYEFTAEELMYINACMGLGIIAAFIKPPLDDLSVAMGRRSISVLDVGGMEKLKALAVKINHYGAEAIDPEFAKAVTTAVEKITSAIDKASNN